MEEIIGYVLIIGSILMFGSFAAPLIIIKNKKLQIDLIIIHFYQSLAVGISCQLLTIFVNFNYDPIIIIASFLYVIISILVQNVIKLIGISISISIISSGTILISFLWGVLLFPSENKITNYLLVSFALFFLIMGIILMGFCKIITISKTNGRYKICINNESPVLHNEEENNLKKLKIGIFLSLFAGLLNGSSLTPIQYVSIKENKELITFIAFYGLGILFFTNIVNLIFAIKYYFNNKKLPNYYFKKSFILVFSSGIIWNIGFICTIYATSILGLAIAFPLSQLSLMVNGFWGIVVFKEIKKKLNIFVWILSVLIILSGAVMYSFSIN